MTFSTPNPPVTLPALSKLRVGREARTGAGISVGKAVAGQLFGGSAHIARVGGKVAEFALQARAST